jgi:hypothetical protein
MDADRAVERTWRTLAPAFGVAFLQLVVTVVVSVLWGIDAIHVAGCATCDPSLGETHRLLFLVPTAVAWFATLVSLPVGYRWNRSPAWVPGLGIVVIIGAYAVSRIVGYRAA